MKTKSSLFPPPPAWAIFKKVVAAGVEPRTSQLSVNLANLKAESRVRANFYSAKVKVLSAEA